MIDTSLLLIGHGSQSAQWNREIVQIVLDMREAKHPSASFNEIDHCFMEHGKPSIPEAVSRWTGEMRHNVIALPLFLSISDHVLNDIPNELSTCTELIEKNDSFAIYKRGEYHVYLFQPPKTSGLIAENCARRFQSLHLPQQNTGILLVYYGSSQFGDSWDQLGRETMDELQKHLPDVHQIDFCYGGHVVAFSAEPTQQKIDELANECERVLILPALVSVGVIQTEVIPAAIELCQAKQKVVYNHDAILPDKNLAKRVLSYAEEKSSLLFESTRL